MQLMSKNNTRIFINLTNGIEAIEKHKFEMESVYFLRIQSSHCESHKWEKMLLELDSNFLMSLALGYRCLVYDYGAQAEISKAIYFGLEWIRYFLNRRWLGRITNPIVKGKNISNYFEGQYEHISKQTRKHIDYYKKYLFTEEIHLEGISSTTLHDNHSEYYREILRRALLSHS